VIMAPISSVGRRKHCTEQSRYVQFSIACLVIVLVFGCDIRDIRRDSMECRQIYDGVYASDAIRTDCIRHKYTDDTLEVELRFTSRHDDTLVTAVNFMMATTFNDYLNVPIVPGSVSHETIVFYFLRYPRDTQERLFYLMRGETNVFRDSSVAVQLLRIPPKSSVTAIIRIPPEEVNFVLHRRDYVHRFVFNFREIGLDFREVPGAPLETFDPAVTESIAINPSRPSIHYLMRYRQPFVVTPDPRNTVYVTRQFYSAYLKTAETHRAVVEF